MSSKDWVVVDTYPHGQAHIRTDAVIAVAEGENGTRIFLKGGAILHVPGEPEQVVEHLKL